MKKKMSFIMLIAFAIISLNLSGISGCGGGGGSTTAGTAGSTTAGTAGSTTAGTAGGTTAGTAGSTTAGTAGGTTAGTAGSTTAGTAGGTTAGTAGSTTAGTALSTDADLSALSFSSGTLSPTFSASVTTYTVPVNFLTQAIRLTATLSNSSATMTINGVSSSSGVQSGNITLNTGDNTITVVVTAQDTSVTKTYTITVNRETLASFAQQAYIKANNNDAIDSFGYAVAIDGDTLVVGAIVESSNATTINGDGADNSASASGAAYVFTRSGSTWTQQAYLKASNAQANDQFGYAVAIDGDTLVVGANGEDSNAITINGDGADNSASASGAAYVFTRSGATWTQQAYLKASNAQATDYFGSAVGIDGDTIVVGAIGESSNATTINGDGSDNTAFSAGAAYVFIRSGGSWAQQAYLKASNAETVDYFGGSIAISGDTVVVGATGESSNATTINGNTADNSAISAGSSYVFTRSGGSWTQQAYLKASNAQAGDQFGYTVAISGDTVVVGAIGESSNATTINGDGTDNTAFAAGAAYVFTRTGTAWTQQAYLKASNAQTNDQFGYDVAISGDAVVIGAIQESSNATTINGDGTDNTAFAAGAAYVFTRTGTAWTQQAYLKASNAQANDQFGYAVGIYEDTIVVGANGEDSHATTINGDGTDNSAPASGATYIFQ